MESLKTYTEFSSLEVLCHSHLILNKDTTYLCIPETIKTQKEGNLLRLINRVAMGRVQFLLCAGFIIIIFIINRAAMGRVRFLFCTGFIIFFFLSVTRRKPPLGQIVIGTESRNL